MVAGGVEWTNAGIVAELGHSGSAAASVAPAAAGGLFGPALELVGSLSGAGMAVVTFEDLHWADPVTWDLFDFLARNLVDEQVVLVGTYRAYRGQRQCPATPPAG